MPRSKKCTKYFLIWFNYNVKLDNCPLSSFSCQGVQKCIYGAIKGCSVHILTSKSPLMVNWHLSRSLLFDITPYHNLLAVYGTFRMAWITKIMIFSEQIYTKTSVEVLQARWIQSLEVVGLIQLLLKVLIKVIFNKNVVTWQR